MTIKKYGVEDARVESRPEDNDAETWRRVVASELDDARRAKSSRDEKRGPGED